MPTILYTKGRQKYPKLTTNLTIGLFVAPGSYIKTSFFVLFILRLEGSIKHSLLHFWGLKYRFQALITLSWEQSVPIWFSWRAAFIQVSQLWNQFDQEVAAEEASSSANREKVPANGGAGSRTTLVQGGFKSVKMSPRSSLTTTKMVQKVPRNRTDHPPTGDIKLKPLPNLKDADGFSEWKISVDKNLSNLIRSDIPRPKPTPEQQYTSQIPIESPTTLFELHNCWCIMSEYVKVQPMSFQVIESIIHGRKRLQRSYRRSEVARQDRHSQDTNFTYDVWIQGLEETFDFLGGRAWKDECKRKSTLQAQSIITLKRPYTPVSLHITTERDKTASHDKTWLII